MTHELNELNSNPFGSSTRNRMRIRITELSLTTGLARLQVVVNAGHGIDSRASLFPIWCC
jgi:hypothetical protein